MKNFSRCFNACFFVILLWTGCTKTDDPVKPEDPQPTLTAFSPSSGAVGSIVNLTGSNFSTAAASNIVKFNGTAGTVSVATATRITVSVPQGASTGKISVQVGSKTTTSAEDFVVVDVISPALAPKITSFSPRSGTAGTVVTVDGNNFSSDPAGNTIKFNGVIAVPTAVGANSLTVIAPPAGTTGKITVEVAGQTATSSDDFVYSTTAGVTVSTVAGSGIFGFANGNGTAAQFFQPTGVAVDISGNLYVADAENHRIRMITSSGTVTTLAGSGTAGFADGSSAAARFNSPRAVALDAAGNVYVADGINNRIRKITPTGTVTTLAGSGVSGFADGNGVSAQFHFPKGLCVDATGNVYVADDISHRIRKITPAGTVTTVAGSTLGFTDGASTIAQFNRPTGIAIDADGNVYVADAGNHRIRKITAAGTVSTLAGSSAGFTDNTGTTARFDSPTGVAVDASGNVYVADDDNQRIRKITSSGMVTTLAGGTLSGFADGSIATARFNSPSGVAVDASGVVYVADRQNHRIRKIQ